MQQVNLNLYTLLQSTNQILSLWVIDGVDNDGGHDGDDDDYDDDYDDDV